MTNREQQVARLVGEGLTYGEIGRRLGISPATVRVHVNAIDREISGDGASPYRRVMAWVLKKVEAATR